jgi:hypothetical protein
MQDVVDLGWVRETPLSLLVRGEQFAIPQPRLPIENKAHDQHDLAVVGWFALEFGLLHGVAFWPIADRADAGVVAPCTRWG